MADVVTYENTPKRCYCQVKLDSGERVLISIAQTGIKIFELGLRGMAPTNALADWSIAEIRSALRIFADLEAPEKPPLDAIRDKILPCRSIADIRELISRES